MSVDTMPEQDQCSQLPSPELGPRGTLREIRL